MHSEADLPNEMNRAQSAGRINDADMHFDLALFPPELPTTSHSIVLTLPEPRLALELVLVSLRMLLP